MKKLLLSGLLLLLVVFAFADAYTIGDGTSTQNYIPFYGFYNYNWSKVIYTQAEINTAGLTNGENIIGIGFYVGNTPSNYTMLDQRVFVRHTDATAYETTDVGYPDNTQFQQVFQGDLTFDGGGWHYIVFSAPFAWNGTQNVEFLFENWDGTYLSGYPNYRYTSTTPNYTGVYKQQDASFPAVDGTRTYNRPNIQLITPTTTAPDPAVVVSPLNGATLVSPSATLNWMPGNIWPDGYYFFLGTDPAATNVVNNENLGNVLTYDPTPDLNLDTTYYWKVVPFNTYGNAADCPIWSFTTHGAPDIETLPYTQNWDQVTAPELPFDWTRIVQSTSTSAFVGTYSSTTYAHSQPNCARLYNPSDADATLILVGPPLATTLPVNEVRVKFWARAGSSNYPLSLGVISDPTDAATYTEVHALTMSNTLTEYICDMTTYTGTGTHIAFKHGLGGTGRSHYIDDITFEQIAPNDLGCDALSGNQTPNVNTAVTYSATVHNWGTAAQSNYTVKLFNSDNVELASTPGVAVDPGMTIDIPLTWTPTAEGEVVLYAKVFLTGDINPANDQSPNLTVSVQSAGSQVVNIGDGTSTNSDTGAPTPYGTYYRNFHQQYLFTAAEILANGGAPGLITALSFNVANVNACSAMPNYTIKLKHTDQTALTTTFEVGDYTQVWFQNEYQPVNGWNVHTLSTPFVWNGTQNLLVDIVTTMITGSYTRNASVYYTPTTGTNTSLRYQSDSTDASSSTTGTTSVNRANIRLFMNIVGMASLNGNVSSGGNPVADASVVITGTIHSTLTDALGNYSFPFVEPGTYNVTASKLGYESLTLPVTLVADETTTLNFVLTPSSSVNVTGFVVGSDQPTVGLAEATVSLTGIVDYSATTDATGHFTIPGVLSGNTYDYIVIKEGYQNLTGSITVGATAYDMGTLILPEIAFPPSQVVATENIAQTQVDLIWHSPVPAPPYDDFELNDGGWVPSSNWSDPLGDWEWTNTYDVNNYDPSGSTSSQIPPPTAYSGTGLWGTVIYGPYSNCSGWSYLKKTFNLSGVSNPVLNLWHYMDGFNTWDYGLIKVNGNTVWGSSAAAVFMPWQEITVSLANYANQANVEVSFEWYATSVVNYAGWYIDDVYVGPARASGESVISAIEPADLRGLDEFEAATLEELANLNASPAYVVRDSKPQPNAQSRVLTGYKVWRLLAVNEGDETQWTSLTPASIADTTFVDTAWSPLPSGVYKYAVKAVYTNDVLSGAVFSNEIHKGMMGTLSGTVTEFGTNVPIAGATITAGDYSGTSGPDGSYAFLAYQGTYDVTCSKQGYQSSTVTGVNIVGTQTTTQNFVLTEITLPPGGVTAVEAGPDVNVTWSEPGTAGGEWIQYSTVDANNSIGLTNGGEFAVAIRFPPSALQDYVGMSLRAIKFWPGDPATYTLKVWTGGTASAPAVEATSQPVTVDTYDAWMTVNLNNPVGITGNEELWFGYNIVHTSGYPAGCDPGPAIDGFGNMIYSNSAWTTLLTLASSLNYNWSIQGYVGYSYPNIAPMISPVVVETTGQPVNAGFFSLKTDTPRPVVQTVPEKAIRPDRPADRGNRVLNGYKVWRLQQGQESNETSWIQLTQDVITATAWQDNGWNGLPDGTYKWAVKAVYTGNAMSVPAFSNPLTKITEIGTIAGIVRTQQNAPIMGATVTCGDVTATTNASGAYSMQVVAGTHSVTASAAGYAPSTQTGVIVVTGQTTTVNFQLAESLTIFEDGFESYDNFALEFAPWTLVDVDQSSTYGMSTTTWPNAYEPMAYMIFVPSATTPPLTELTAHGGIKMAASFAAVMPSSGGNGPNNDWMITPVLTNPAEIRFWARSYTAQYGLERFKVGTSTGGTNPNDFTIISGTNYIQPPVEWTEYTYDIPAGATRIGIQCVSNDAFIFLVDDVTVMGGTAIEDPGVPVVATELHGNFPNPFNPETTIRYSVKEATPVSIDIYNVKGQLVKTLVNENKASGHYSVTWNGRDNNNLPVSSGVYFYKMFAGKYSSTRKMILMK